MSKEDVLTVLRQADIKAHMKAVLCVTSPLCEMEDAICEAVRILEESLIEKLSKFCKEE